MRFIPRNGTSFKYYCLFSETANNLLTEIQPAKETMVVNGFNVFSTQVKYEIHFMLLERKL